jgi:hypothetical protein
MKLFALFLVPALLLFVAAVLFRSLFFASALVLPALLLLPVKLNRVVLNPFLAAALLIIALGGLRDVQTRIDKLNHKLETRGPEAFSFEEKSAVYLLAAGLVVGGYPLYPAAAKEQFHLLFPGPKVREWESDFAMESPKVAAAVAELGRAARAGDTAPDPAEVFYALNPLTLEARAARDEKGGYLAVTGTVPVRYPRRSRTALIKLFGRSFCVEEGLFWMLQESGWLHPYSARWRWRAALAG